MEILLLVIAVLLTLIGIAGCILPGIPGTIFSYIALLCCYGCDSTLFTPSQLLFWAGVSVVVMILDYFLPAYMTKIFGGSKASAWGSIIGLFAGIFFTPIGMLAGSFLGAIIGELIHDNSDVVRAVKAGIGSFFAFLLGTGLKLVASLWMAWLVGKEVYAYFVH